MNLISYIISSPIAIAPIILAISALIAIIIKMLSDRYKKARQKAQSKQEPFKPPEELRKEPGWEQSKGITDIPLIQQEQTQPKPEVQQATAEQISLLIGEKKFHEAFAEILNQKETPELLFQKADVLVKLDRIEEAKRILISLEGTYRQDQISFLMGQINNYQENWREARYWFTIASRFNTTAKRSKEYLAEIDIQLPKELDVTSEDILHITPIKSDIKLDDVIGLKNVKEYLRQNVIEAIKHPEDYKRVGKKISTGVIFYGPPGVGKTMIAKGLAHDSDAYFLAANLSQLVASYVGKTPKNIEAFFTQAREHKPCVVFFDEVDVIGTKRGNDQDANSSVMKQGVNALITELDGIRSNNEGLFIISTTNRIHDIDPALAGRQNRLGDFIYVSLPSYWDRKKLIKKILSNLSHDGKNVIIKVSIGRIARATQGFSPADIAGIIDKALNYTLERWKASNKQREPLLLTIDILRIIWPYKSSVPAWFNGMAIEISNKFTPEDIVKYRDLVSDINRNINNPLFKGANWFISFTAKYIV